jgi:hypothetical protein
VPYGRERDRLPRWQQARQKRFMPTGELRITIEEGYGREGRQAEFGDTKRATLEERLPDVLRELEIRAAEDDWRRQEQRRQDEEKHRRWDQAMDQARHDYREARLAQLLRSQLGNWQLGRELDDYLTELEAAIAAIASRREQEAAAEWLAWARQYRHAINSPSHPPCPALPLPHQASFSPSCTDGAHTGRRLADLGSGVGDDLGRGPGGQRPGLARGQAGFPSAVSTGGDAAGSDAAGVGPASAELRSSQAGLAAVRGIFRSAVA